MLFGDPEWPERDSDGHGSFEKEPAPAYVAHHREGTSPITDRRRACVMGVGTRRCQEVRMRTMSMLAFLVLALSGCGGAHEAAQEPDASEQVGGEVQAERGDAEGTPGIDSDVRLQSDGWCPESHQMHGQVGAEHGGAEGTPGLDADVDCPHDDAESDLEMP
jgi:hypothetical protein